MTAPAWTIPPDWENGITERLEWLTDVQQSPRGVEQRRQRRLAPRRTFDFRALAHGRERALLDYSTYSAGGAAWLCPIWHDVAWLNPLTAGAMSLPVATDGREFVAGGQALLLGAELWAFEVVTVQSLSASALNLTEPLAASYAQGARVYPLRAGLLAQQPKVSRLSDNTAWADVRMQLTEPSDWPAMKADTYRGHPILSTRPEHSEALDYENQRLLQEIDNGRGQPWRRDTGYVGFGGQSHKLRAYGRAEHTALRSLLYYLAGRLRPIWMPTWCADIELAKPVPAAQKLVDIHYCGYSRHALLGLHRRDLRLELADGSVHYRRITGAADMHDGTERLVLDEVLPVTVGTNDLVLASWMALSRLDQDAVELTHHSDGDGVASCSLLLRGVFDEHRAGLGYDLGMQLGTNIPPWPPRNGLGRLFGESLGGVPLWPRVNGSAVQ